MDSENLFRQENERLVLLDNLHEMVFKFRVDGRLIYINPVFKKILHYDQWEAARISFENILRPDQIMKWCKIRERLAQGAAYASIEFVFKTRENKEVYAAGSLQPLMEGGDTKSVTGIFQDITSMKKAEKERDRLFLFSIDMMAILGYDGYFKRVNPAFQKILGFPEEDFLQKPFIEFVHPGDREETLREFSRLKSGTPGAYFQNRYVHRDGSVRWLSWSGHPVPGESLIYAVARDVTPQREIEDSLKRMAFTDDLTRLFNRRGFYVVAERMLKIAWRRRIGFLLMIADLDGMKFINDNYGHREGDMALITTAQILRDRFRDSDVVARLGGDEFVAALLTESRDQSEQVRKSLENTFAEHSRQKNRLYNLSLSMGFAFARPETRIPLEELMANADQKMYELKRRRRLARAG